jgi:hypothetical protein
MAYTSFCDTCHADKSRGHLPGCPEDSIARLVDAAVMPPPWPTTNPLRAELERLAQNGEIPAVPWREIVRQRRDDDHVDVAKYTIKPGWTLPKAQEPKPPTLREWLGDRVSELGRWADVLREQPVPVGEVVAWEWYQSLGIWQLRVRCRVASSFTLGPGDILHGLRGPIPGDEQWLDVLQMAFFRRHPGVKPEPTPVTIGCEDQYEVMP